MFDDEHPEPIPITGEKDKEVDEAFENFIDVIIAKHRAAYQNLAKVIIEEEMKQKDYSEDNTI